MPAGSMEGIHGAQEAPTVAPLCPGYPEELEKLLPAQGSGRYYGSDGLAGIQGEEPLR